MKGARERGGAKRAGGGREGGGRTTESPDETEGRTDCRENEVLQSVIYG